MALYSSKDIELRLYDGTPGTPNYIRARFIGDGPPEITMPVGYADPEETLFTDRQQATSEMSYVAGPDNTVFAQVPITFSFLIDAAQREMVDSWGNPTRKSPWVVGGVTLQPVAIADLGTRINGRGVAVACAGPAAQSRIDSLMNIYLQLPAPPGGGNNLTYEYRGFSRNPNEFQVTVQNDVIQVTAGGMIYGAINEIADFPTGTEVTPA